jgi:hypothetical protein
MAVDPLQWQSFGRLLVDVGVDAAGPRPSSNCAARSLRSKASFARLCGPPPIPACPDAPTATGCTADGDRQASTAHRRIAPVRMHCHQPTKDYVLRTAEGKTETEILRCLKRYIARQVDPLLLATPPSQIMAT